MSWRYVGLRNIARRFALPESLEVVWALYQHVAWGKDLVQLPVHIDRYGNRVPAGKLIHEFHLDQYVRELLLHAGEQGTATLQNWQDLAQLHNAIRAFGDHVCRPDEDVMLELHRLSQQQFPNFDRVGPEYLGRYTILFRQPALDSLLRSHFGLSSLEYLVLSAAVFALSMQHPVINVRMLDALGLPSEAVSARLKSVTATREELRASLTASQSFGSDWQYAFNEIERRPLVQFGESHQLHCPLPSRLLKRLLAGAYFDLVGQPGFDKAFGDSVEATVGDVVRAAAAPLNMERPSPYISRYGRRFGADWLLSDGTGLAFIECKTARIPLSARVGASRTDVEDGLERLSDAVVQNYQNIQDALDGLTPEGVPRKPAFSLVVTLEDWNVFARNAAGSLQMQVNQKLARKGLPETLLTDVPFAILSVRELPKLSHALATYGVASVLARKTSGEFPSFLMGVFLEDQGFSRGAPERFFTTYAEEIRENAGSRVAR